MLRKEVDPVFKETESFPQNKYKSNDHDSW